ncbi:MAG: metallophosphoesterase [bacterium]|nr:metallophosphoesterase [bacterium]
MKIVMFLVFISTAITIYSLLNYYFIRKHKNIITLKSLPRILFRLVLITIILTPILTIIFSWNNIPVMAAFTGFPGYSWIAFLFLFLMIHGTADIILFIVEKAGVSPPAHLARRIFIVTMLLSIAVLVFGYHEARQIRVERLTIKTTKLPPEAKPIRILQLSDIHFSPVISVETAQQIKEITLKEMPDIIVSTGDLLDRGILEGEQVNAVMKSLKAPLGKIAVPGNHEFFAGIKNSTEFTKKAGFTMLRNEAITISGILNIAGVDDPAAKRTLLETLPGTRPLPEKEILSPLDSGKYTILLKHQPRIDSESRALFDLQLSGHTHAGQIFPFTLIVKLVFPYLCGLYEIDDNTKLYVNRGTGTWGPPFRFLAPPEITVIDLVPEERQTQK